MPKDSNLLTYIDDREKGLKPMDSFGTVVKISSLNYNVYSSVWIVNALSIVCSEMLKLSRNNQKYQNVRGPPPPQHSAIGNIHTDIWLLDIIALMLFKTIAGGFNGALWWYGPLSEDREKI